MTITVDAGAFASLPPRVRLTNAFAAPLDNAIAAARTCYSARLIATEEVSKDARAIETRDRLARETMAAGHHTIFQHATFQFSLERVSRQLVWSLLHAHPFYNSEQVSQRYVEVRSEAMLLPRLPEREARLYRDCAERMMRTYRALLDLLTPPAAEAYYALFPGRAQQRQRWDSAVKKRAQEVARYSLPLATFTHLYHTISGLTLFRYARICACCDVPTEAREVIGQMVALVDAHDPHYLTNLEDPLPLEETPEYRALAELGLTAGSEARAFIREFDASLGDHRHARLIDHSARGEATLASAIRAALGLTRARLGDAEALRLALSPDANPILGEVLNLGTLDRVTRALAHVHYTFRKRLSHTADSQDQRHRMVPASRPLLAAQYVGLRGGAEPDLVIPELLERCAPARELFLAAMRESFGDVDRLLDAGVPHEWALLLLPNAFPIRFEESGDLLNLHHKWTARLCYTAQEEIWRASLEEVEQVRALHPAIGDHLGPPCHLRLRAGAAPFCPEGPRYCGVPVWRRELGEFERVI